MSGYQLQFMCHSKPVQTSKYVTFNVATGTLLVYKSTSPVIIVALTGEPLGLPKRSPVVLVLPVVMSSTPSNKHCSDAN
jgi:hypothetical protein